MMGDDNASPEVLFPQHDDDDVIIPDQIARLLVVSSHLFLILAIICYIYQIYILAALATVLYLTSIWHWHKPRFSSVARRCDYLAVLCVVAYASYYATTEDIAYIIVWFSGFAVLSIIFVTNEYRYYQQVMRNPLGKDTSNESENATVAATPAVVPTYDEETCCGGCIAGTRPNTAERDYVYKRTVYTHCAGVHCLGFSLACIIIIMSHYDPDP